MNLTENVKEAIRRVIASEEHRPMDATKEDLITYDNAWQKLKNEMCQKAGVVGAITAYMVSTELRNMVTIRTSRYKRPWVI
jgi:hypothetical protein